MKCVDLDKCEWDRARRVLHLTSEHVGMPAEVLITSHHTGRGVIFRPVQPGDDLWDQDGWDGEQCIYRPTTATKVDYLVIYNQY